MSDLSRLYADEYRLPQRLGVDSPTLAEYLRLYDHFAIRPIEEMKRDVAGMVTPLSATPGASLGEWLVNRLFGADPTRHLESALGPINPADVTYAIDHPQPTSKTRPDLFSR
jgi:hypothetical protein